jgi:hypothetical protein
LLDIFSVRLNGRNFIPEAGGNFFAGKPFGNKLQNPDLCIR